LAELIADLRGIPRVEYFINVRLSKALVELKTRGDRNVTPLLVAMMMNEQNPEKDRHWAADLLFLEEFKWQPATLDEQAVFAVAHHDRQCDRFGSAVTAPLIRFLKSDLSSGKALSGVGEPWQVRVLGRVGDPRAVDAIIDLFESYITEKPPFERGNGNTGTIWEVIEALGETADPRAITTLGTGLSEPRLVQQRSAIIECLLRNANLMKW